jgi:hypothetical protein
MSKYVSKVYPPEGYVYDSEYNYHPPDERTPEQKEHDRALLKQRDDALNMHYAMDGARRYLNKALSINRTLLLGQFARENPGARGAASDHLWFSGRDYWYVDPSTPK